ncbi:gamma-glutamyltransferase 5-like [Arapaima gigas]
MRYAPSLAEERDVFDPSKCKTAPPSPHRPSDLRWLDDVTKKYKFAGRLRCYCARAPNRALRLRSPPRKLRISGSRSHFLTNKLTRRLLWEEQRAVPFGDSAQGGTDRWSDRAAGRRNGSSVPPNMVNYSSRVRCCCLCLALLFFATVVILCVVRVLKTECPHGQFRHATVAADSERCSQIGREILQQGGSAVDGAIAALLCTSVVNPQSMGLGGGSLFTVLDKTGTVKVITSRETVPKHFNKGLLNNCPKSSHLLPGSEWIGVPGEIRGYELAHRLYGKLPWAKLFEPTIRLARDGFPVPHYLGRVLSHTYTKSLIENSSLCDVFCNKKRTVLQPGETLRFPMLAKTMRIIAEEGADSFYTGKIAHDLIEDVKNAGGTLSLEDLQSFQAKELNPWAVQIGEYDMYIPPPPAGGAILSLILNIMKGYNLNSSSIEGDQKTLTYHRYVEACKFANGQRKNIHDPNFSSAEEANLLMKEEFAENMRKRISDKRTHKPEYYNITPSMDRFGTTHVSVLAADGTAVSVTSTINHIFGSMVYSPKTGIILNNELADFCGNKKNISAGEQPPSSMAPAILYAKSNKKILVIGGSGGNLITTGMTLALMNHLWLGKNLTDAITAPVLFVDAKNEVNPEKNFDGTVMAGLRRLGHTEGNFSLFLNVVNAASKDGTCISAMSDTRKMGRAAGY